MINFERQTMNRLTVVGELVSSNLEERMSRNGKQMIMGNVDVEVKKEDKVNVIELKVLCMAGSKLYPAIKTVMTEYKTRQIDGTGDKIKVQGSVDVNEYVGNDGTLKTFNVCNARFFHRLTEAEYAQEGDKAELTFVGTYMKNKELLDSEGLPSGYHEIEVYGRGYNGTSKKNDKINCLKGLKMNDELFEMFDNEFSVGERLALEIEVNRGVIVREAETSKGFGRQPVIQSNSYRWDYEIVGGNSQGEVEEEDMEELRRLRRQQQADITGDGMVTEGKGFGTKANSKKEEPQTGLDPFSDDIPF